MGARDIYYISYGLKSDVRGRKQKWAEVMKAEKGGSLKFVMVGIFYIHINMYS
jgi:hypothetical protein